jgi:hypothetical protein
VSQALLFHVLSDVVAVEFGDPLDSELFGRFRCGSPDESGTLFNAGLVRGRIAKSHKCLNVDDASERETEGFKQLDVVFDAGLKLDISEIGANVFDLLRDHASIVKDENESVWIAKHNWDSAFLTFVRRNVELELAVALGVET